MGIHLTPPNGGTIQIGVTPISGGTQGALLWNDDNNNFVKDTGSSITYNGSDFLGFRTSSPTHTISLASTTTGIALYNTADETVNYERGLIAWSSNEFFFRTQIGGSGTNRSLSFATPSGAKMQLNQTSSNPVWTMNAGSSGTARQMGQFSGTQTQTSGATGILNLNVVYNQASGTAANTDLLISRTETAVGSGTQLFLNCTVGGNTKFSVSNTGLITTNSTTMIASNQAFTDGAAAQVGTLTNAPAAGNPTKWIPINDNGTTRYIPAW